MATSTAFFGHGDAKKVKFAAKIDRARAQERSLTSAASLGSQALVKIGGNQWKNMDVLPAFLGTCHQHFRCEGHYPIHKLFMNRMLKSNFGGEGIRTPVSSQFI